MFPFSGLAGGPSNTLGLDWMNLKIFSAWRFGDSFKVNELSAPLTICC